jgi:hypothetical protein
MKHDFYGIRPGVWLFLLLSLLLCTLSIGIVERDRNDLQVAMASRSSNRLTSAQEVSFRGPEATSRTKATWSRRLTAQDADVFARKLANAKAIELFECEPFRNSTAARFVDGQWVWSARQALGYGDIEASVSFGADGSQPAVEIFVLHNRAFEPF